MTSFYSIGKRWLLRQECNLGSSLGSVCFCLVLGQFCCVVGGGVVGGYVLFFGWWSCFARGAFLFLSSSCLFC